MNGVLRNNPNVEIYLWTPIKKDCAKFNNNCININGNHLEEYVGVFNPFLIKTCEGRTYDRYKDCK